MTLPTFVTDGFLRDDVDSRFFDGHRPAAVGQLIHIQINLNRPLVCVNEEEGDEHGKTTWTIFGGRVIAVYSATRIGFVASFTCDNWPWELEGEWSGILKFDPEAQFPWVLETLEPLPETQRIKK